MGSEFDGGEFIDSDFDSESDEGVKKLKKLFKVKCVKKDSNVSKRGLFAYMFFFVVKCVEIIVVNFLFGVIDVVKVFGEKWKMIIDEEKSVY